MQSKLITFIVFLSVLLITSCKKKEEEHLPVHLKFDIENKCCSHGGSIRTINKTVNADVHKWDFGDGNTSSEYNPVHKYETPESYKVAYIAKHSGSGETISDNIIIVAHGTEPFDYDTLDAHPQYKGGWEKYFDFLDATIEYPHEAFNAGIEGDVVIKFTITRFATVMCAEIYESCHILLDSAALFPFTIMPKWEKASVLNGEAVTVDFYQTISFIASKEEGMEEKFKKLKKPLYFHEIEF